MPNVGLELMDRSIARVGSADMNQIISQVVNVRVAEPRFPFRRARHTAR